MRQKGHLKKKLRRKLLAKLGPIFEGDRVVVVCVGDDCASREENRATFAEARRCAAAAHDPQVRVHCYGCLKVCKKGTVVAVLPEATVYRRVRPEDVGELVLLASRRAQAADAPSPAPRGDVRERASEGRANRNEEVD